MNNKINCQLINILLNKDNTFANKYTSITSGSFDYDNLLENYFENKDMRSIKIDNDTQSICFTNQNSMINIYNSENKKREEYYEEVHIHCNDLSMFDNFVKYLKSSDYKNVVNDKGGIPHSDAININNLKNCELVMEPMTNEVATTKSLLNLLSKNSDETIFRAIAIHFGKLVDRNSYINFELIHKLNDIYKKDVEGTDYGFFSDEISNKFLNIYNDENSFETKVARIPSQSFEVQNDHHIVYTVENDDYENSY